MRNTGSSQREISFANNALSYDGFRDIYSGRESYFECNYFLKFHIYLPPKNKDRQNSNDLNKNLYFLIEILFDLGFKPLAKPVKAQMRPVN